MGSGGGIGGEYLSQPPLTVAASLTSHTTNASERASERDTYIFLLTGRIPEAELDGLVAGREVDDVVVEHGRDVVLGEAVVGVRDEQAGLTHSTVADHDELHTHATNDARRRWGQRRATPASEREQPPRLGG